MKSKKLLISLLTTLLASSCSLIIKPLLPSSSSSSQPASSSSSSSSSSNSSSTTNQDNVAKVKAVEDAINNIGSVTLDSLGAIENAEALFNALSEELKLEVSTEAKEKLTSARNTYDELKAKDEADTNAANAVVTLINNIGSVTLDSESAIKAAEDALQALTADQLAKVSKEAKDKLTNARETYNTLKSDNDDIKEVEDAIKAIGTVTLEDKDAIENAEALLEALDDELKEKIDASLKEDLEVAREEYNQLLKEKEDADNAAKVNEVKEAINAIGNVTLDSKDKIDEASALYNALPKNLKDSFDAALLKVLEDAKKKYAELLAANAPDSTVFEFGENGTAEHKDGNEINAGKTFNEGDYTLELTNVSKVYDGAKDAKGNSAIKIGTGSAIGTFTITVPNDVNKVIFLVAGYKAKTSKISVNDVDYTLKTSSDNGEYEEIEVDTTNTKTVVFSTVSGATRCMINSIELVRRETPVDPDAATIKTVSDAIILIGDVTLEDKSNIENAEALYNALTPEQKAKVNASLVKDLEDARTKYDQLVVEKETADTNAAKAVEDLINAIGQVSLNNEKAIIDAENALEELTEDQLAKVSASLIKALEDARKEFNELKENANADELDQIEANKVIDAINAIGEVTLEDKKAIEDAEALLDNLTPNQLAKVSQDIINKLTTARNTYDALAVEEEIKNIEEKFEELGEVTLNSKDALENIEALLNELSDKAKQTERYEELVEQLNIAYEEYNALVESQPNVGGVVATFDFGDNGAAGTHVDGKDIGTSKSYTEGNYTLELTNATKVFDGEKDAKGNSAIKLGTSSVTGTFTITVPNNVTKVIFLVAGYKAKTSKINVNGKDYTLTTSSDNGEYEEIEVDTSSTKTITFSTVSGATRCMINTIKFVSGNGGTINPDPNPEPDPEPDPEPNPNPNPNPDGNLTVESTEGVYYEGLRGKWGPELDNALKSLLKDTHSKTTSYDSLKGHYAISDLGPSGKIMTFYAHAEFLVEWDGSQIDREHVWPKSLGWFTESGAGSDLHHIRPSIKSINSSRGNKPFGDINEASANKVQYNNYLGGYSDGTYFEPLDHSKGDVARILMYMTHRYSEEVKSYPLTTVAQSMDMLVRWHELDPVDDYEMRRNNYTASIQGNRNPFIDHPEFVDMIYDNNYEGDGALNDTTGGNSQLTDAQKIEKVVNAIDAIGTVTLESESKINAALNAYNSLSSELKAKISDKYAVLQAAKAEYDRLVEENENQNPDPKPEPDPDVPSGSIVFDFGDNGSATHKDGSSDTATYSEVVGNYSLNISEGSKMYPGSYDAKGNSCIKFGTKSIAGTMKFTVPSDINSVTFKLAKYKTNASKVKINDVEYSLTQNSDDGKYDEITIDTSTNKSITFTTLSGGYRCMLNSILFNGASLEDGENNEENDDVIDGGNDNDDPVVEGNLKLSTSTLFDGLSGSSYATYNGEHTVGELKITTSDILKNASYYPDNEILQFKASSGNLTTGSATVTSITIVLVDTFDIDEKAFVVTVGNQTLTGTVVSSEATGVKNKDGYEFTVTTLKFECNATGAITIKNNTTYAKRVLEIEIK